MTGEHLPRVLHPEDATRTNRGYYGRRLTRKAVCPQCKRLFRMRNKNSKHCSNECRAEAQRKVPLEELPRIIELWSQGWTWVRLGKLYKVHHNSVRRTVLQHFEKLKERSKE